MQVVQVEALVAFLVSRPLGQGRHTLAAICEGRKVRRGQASHVVAPTALGPRVGPDWALVGVRPVTNPALQSLHDLEPAKAAKVVGGVSHLWLLGLDSARKAPQAG